jgi:hypothetical protein
MAIVALVLAAWYHVPHLAALMLPQAAAIVVAGHASRLSNFSVTIASAFALMPAIWAQTNSTAFSSNGLNITLLQNNVSNVFKLEGVGWEVVGNVMNQVGSCNYPNYGPKSDSTPFQPSVTIYAHNSRAGLLANNTVYWRCSAFDLDVSDRVILEDNRFICTETGVVPHGNSISGCKRCPINCRLSNLPSHSPGELPAFRRVSPTWHVMTWLMCAAQTTGAPTLRLGGGRWHAIT